MRKLKKALSLTLALALSLVMAVPAFAAEPTVFECEGVFQVSNVIDIRSDPDIMGCAPLTCLSPAEITCLRDLSIYAERWTIEEAEQYENTYQSGDVFQLTKPGSYDVKFNWEDGEGYSTTRISITVKDSSDASTDPEQPTQPTTPVVTDGNGNYKVHTTAGKGLNVRTGPGTNYKRASAALREGTVVEVVEIQGQWGKLANDAGWVFMPGLDKVAAAPAQPEKPAQPEYPVTMQVSNSKGALNVRTGPGTNYKLAGPSLKNGTTIEVVEAQGQWGKLANDAGWVYLPGAKTVKG